MVSRFSHVRFFVTLWTVAPQASLSMEFSRQEYCSELTFPSLGDLPNSGIKPGSPALEADLSHQGSPLNKSWVCNLKHLFGFPGSSAGKESAYNVGDVHLIPGWRRYPAEGNGNPLQYSCLKNSMDREAWGATVHDIPERSGHDL